MRFQVNRSIRCHRCYMHHASCLCDLAPMLSGQVRLGVLLHISEIFKSTATARLLPLAWENTWLSFRGVPPGFDHPVYETLKRESPGLESLTPSRTELLLFPDDDAIPLEPGQFTGAINLLVPDGNWNQAARMIKRVERFRNAIKVKLPGIPDSPLPMRTQKKPGRVSTFEAVSEALGILEGAPTKERLMSFFRLMVERHRLTLGRE